MSSSLRSPRGAARHKETTLVTEWRKRAAHMLRAAEQAGELGHTLVSRLAEARAGVWAEAAEELDALVQEAQ